MGKGTYDSAGIAARVFFCTVPQRAETHTNESLDIFPMKVAAFIDTPVERRNDKMEWYI